MSFSSSAKRALALAAPAAVALTLVSGCGQTNPTAATTTSVTAIAGLPTCSVLAGGHLVLAMGRRVNAPDPGNLPASVTAQIDHSIDVHAPISVERVDGQPVLLGTDAFAPTGKNASQVTLEQSRFVASLNTAISSGVAPVAPGAAPLQGLALAARTAGSTGDALIVLSDSLLSTVSPLDYTVQGMFQADPDDVVAALKSAKALPDLTGIGVLVTGAGDTAAPQPRLTGSARASLLAVWTKILVSAGARCVSFDTTPNTAASAAADGPSVPIVPVPADPDIHPGSTAVTTRAEPQTVTVQTTATATATTTATRTASVTCPAGVPLPDDATYGFVPGSDQLRDPAAATVGLHDLIVWLAADPTHQVKLLGTTARWGSKSYQVGLAKRRSATMGALITTGTGVQSTQVHTDGVGSYWPGYVTDNDAQHTLLPGPAARNRTVIVTTYVTASCH